MAGDGGDLVSAICQFLEEGCSYEAGGADECYFHFVCFISYFWRVKVNEKVSRAKKAREGNSVTWGKLILLINVVG
jgi:hypothetical protein